MAFDRTYGMFSTDVKRRLEHIRTTNDEVNDLIRPYIEKRMDEYKQRFGEFERLDRDLWHNVDLTGFRNRLLQETLDLSMSEYK